MSESSAKHSLNKAGLLYLLIVYVVWGSTYLAIRVGVREGSGFTPFMFGAMRVFVAGAILLAWAAIMRQRLLPTRRELLILFSSGILLWAAGNGLVLLGETRADSGLAALIIASTPIWVALVQGIWDRKMPSLLLIGSLLVGSIGIIILSMPTIQSGLKGDFLSILAIILASLTWAVGSVIQSRNPSGLSPVVNSAYQMIFGGVGFAILAIVLQEPLPHPTPEAWAAWGYLVVFGSIIAFTSYVQALQLLPITIVSTYSYVNPIIAVILGWLILGEKITVWTIGGAIFLLIGITGVIRSHQKH